MYNLSPSSFVALALGMTFIRFYLSLFSVFFDVSLVLLSPLAFPHISAILRYGLILSP